LVGGPIGTFSQGGKNLDAYWQIERSGNIEVLARFPVRAIHNAVEILTSPIKKLDFPLNLNLGWSVVTAIYGSRFRFHLFHNFGIQPRIPQRFKIGNTINGVLKVSQIGKLQGAENSTGCGAAGPPYRLIFR
jgi:hypothetical protein